MKRSSPQDQESPRAPTKLSEPDVQFDASSMSREDLVDALNKLRLIEVRISMDKITCLPDNYLKGCKYLETVTFDCPLVTEIGNGFLEDCSSLEDVRFQGLPSLKCVGDGFLRGCTNLKTVSFEGLKSLTFVGEGFLSDCTSLTRVDFAGMSSLTSVGDGFLHGCTNLKTVNNMLAHMYFAVLDAIPAIVN